MACRYSTDRSLLGKLVGGEPELTEVAFGAGDSHRGGQTVAVLALDCGRAAYKPRSVEVDAALARLLPRLLPDEPQELRIRVPEVVGRGDYGWAEYIEHRYCTDDQQLRTFYRGLGHWLAVTRLLSASDLHSENVIAAGPVPIIVDCETLFTPHQQAPPSGYGEAVDRAADLIRGSVLRTGLLPGRGAGLGLRGADVSAAGSLPDEQPEVPVTTVVDAGTDLARLGFERAPRPSTQHQPTREPRLGEHWPYLLAGFDELTERLTDLDRRGQLQALLAHFRPCPIRLVLRETVVYAELGAMLWHPSALHNEPAARQRTAGLLAAQAANQPSAPADPAVIEAEIADLLAGDVPFFSAIAGTGKVTGPAGITLGQPQDLVETALRRWHDLGQAVDRQVISCAPLSAYREESWQPERVRVEPTTLPANDLDRRRRALAADLMHALSENAMRASDRTVAWIAPILGPTGLGIAPLALDLYSGLPGVAILLAAYQREVNAGRADPVGTAAALLDDTLHTLVVMDAQAAADRRAHPDGRPDLPGGYVGLGSRVWGWSLLARLGAVEPGEGLSRARALAEALPEAVSADDAQEILTGAAGAVVPLLRLAEFTGEQRWRREAIRIGDRLASLAKLTEVGARWSAPHAPDGIGGFAHGSAGIGWALARLATATGLDRFAGLADAAFAFQESLYDPAAGGWRDLRKPREIADNWCHGCDGIGVVAADLGADHDPRWREVLGRAAASTFTFGLGATHTLCHGDLGSWEVLAQAAQAGVAPPGLTREALAARILSSLEEFGPRCAMTNNMFRPGLLSGMGGIAYQLLRMHPECDLPSLLLPDPGPPAAVS
jgi:type 2 lantibiotic biosynthesis protein LanM